MVPLRGKIQFRRLHKRWIRETADRNSENPRQSLPMSENCSAAFQAKGRFYPSPRTREPPPIAMLAIDRNESGFRKKGGIREGASGVFLACRTGTRVNALRLASDRDLQAPASATGSSGNHLIGRRSSLVGGHPGAPDAAVRRNTHPFVIALVIILGAVEHRGRHNLCNDRSAELSRLLKTLQ